MKSIRNSHKKFIKLVDSTDIFKSTETLYVLMLNENETMDANLNFFYKSKWTPPITLSTHHYLYLKNTHGINYGKTSFTISLFI